MVLHVMIDLETLSKRSDAAIVQVAALAFDPETGTTSRTFNGVIRNSGGAFDVDTVAWWMQQAHASVLGAKLQDPDQTGDEREVLVELCQFFRLCGDVEAVWAHGATFDFPILESALARCGLSKPWHYRTPRDTRTLFAYAPGGMPKVETNPTREHDALYDCEVQVAQVCGALKALRDQAELAQNAIDIAVERSRCLDRLYDPPPVWSNAEGYTEALANPTEQG